MIVTTFNGQVAVKCYSARTVDLLTAILHNDGYGTKVKLVKAKPKRHPRHFIVMVFPPWH
jgi:hypothetical protein